MGKRRRRSRGGFRAAAIRFVVDFYSRVEETERVDTA